MAPSDHWDAFGQAAATLTDTTVVAGRYSFQRGEEAAALEEIAHKLDLKGDDSLLEIGCGSGNLLLPLATTVTRATGVDHPSCLALIERRGRPRNVELVAGRWPDAMVTGPFDKVLAYSVLHYLSGPVAAHAFIDACLDLVGPGGRVLLGDLPNQDRARRFKATEFGQRFDAEWTRRRVEESSAEDEARDRLMADATATGYIDDRFVLGLLSRYRVAAIEAFVLPQGDGLPFCHTREDVLLVRRN